MTGNRPASVLLTRFIKNEDGAVTVDWVVLAAAVALLSVPLLTVIKSSTQTATTEIADDVVAATD